TATYIDCRQFLVLSRIVRFELGALALQVRPFSVCLRADRHVLTGSHRHRSPNQASDPGNQDAAVRRMCGGDAEEEARGGKNAVIRAKYRGTQPADASYMVPFSHSRAHCSLQSHAWR